jgi:hypothetical protein
MYRSLYHNLNFELYLDLNPSLFRKLFARSFQPLFRTLFASSFGSMLELMFTQLWVFSGRALYRQMLRRMRPVARRVGGRVVVP